MSSCTMHLQCASQKQILISLNKLGSPLSLLYSFTCRNGRETGGLQKILSKNLEWKMGWIGEYVVPRDIRYLRFLIFYFAFCT